MLTCRVRVSWHKTHLVCSAFHPRNIKLGSAELSSSGKAGDETTDLFSPLEKFQRGIHQILLLVFENAEHVAFIKR